jgi:uncharacterized membrane protein
MYILVALAAVVFEACMEAVDKIAIVKNTAIDLAGATFWRNIAFIIWIAIFGAIGIFGSITLLVTWPIMLLGLIFAGSAYFYTYLLKKIEVTSEAALSYASPALYLIIDAVLLGLHFSVFQAAGVLLLAGGGMLFVLDTKGGIRKEFTPWVWMIFIYDFLVNGAEYYSFKYYFLGTHLNEVSYWFDTTLVMIAVLLLIALVQGGWKKLWHAASDHHYFAKCMLSKFFDAGQSCLWLYAITLATVSQVSAIGSIYPLVLIAIVFVVQNVFGYKAKEEFSRGRLSLKFAAVILLCIGGFLIR